MKALHRFLLGSLLLTASVVGFGSSPLTASGMGDRFQQEFGYCVVAKEPRQARLYVMGDGPAPNATACLGTQWAQATFRMQTYLYMLARALLLRDYPDGTQAELARALVSVKSDEFSKTNFRDKAGARAHELQLRQLYDVADCVVRQKASQVDALSRLDTGSVEAQPELARLQPVAADCSKAISAAVPNRSDLHEAMVAALYQLAYSVRKPANA